VGIGRIGKPWKAALLVAVGAVGGGAALAAASVPGGGGVINACYEAADGSGLPVAGPNVHIINSSGGQTCSTVNDATTYVPLDWNQTGPTGSPGTPGTPGAPGAPGAPGTPGTPGAAGKTVTVVGGGTVTLPNREVLTVGPAAAPIPTSGAPIGLLAFKQLKQGAVTVGKRTDSFEILGFSLGIARSTGSNSGQASGRSQQSPITIVKEVDPASPLLLQALVTNEALKTVTISFTRPSSTGQEKVYQRITLTNASISSVERYHPALSGAAGNHDTSELESISLIFQKIQVTNLNPK
jgi:type VI secretion system Hcp family effector